MIKPNNQKFVELMEDQHTHRKTIGPDWAEAVTQLVRASRDLSKTIRAVDLDESVEGAARAVGGLLMSVYGIAYQCGINADLALDDEIKARRNCIYTNPHELADALRHWAQLGVSCRVATPVPNAVIVSAIDQTDADGVYHPDGELLVVRHQISKKQGQHHAQS